MNRNEILELKEIIGGASDTSANKGLIPVSKSTWYRGIKRGHYPRPLRLSPRRVGWRRCDIESLMAALDVSDDRGHITKDRNKATASGLDHCSTEDMAVKALIPSRLAFIEAKHGK